ncbi:MAG: vitamin K epoxide reductase family protein [Chloroflexi bacterium]|nr:vitamin K epoxide reductase family protein [Chloroflexota bacterium]
MLTLGALATSAYLTAAHYAAGEVTLACSADGLVNCELVTSSAQSMLGPFPVALLGTLWSLGMLGLLRLESVRDGRFERAALRGELAWTAGGLAFVFYLLYAELLLIGAICAWCTVVHALVVALFLLSLYRAGELLGAPADELPVPSDAVLAAERRPS